MKFYTTSKLSENMHETPEGYLVCIGVAIARTGEMIYGPGETPLEAGIDGKTVVDRKQEEVFRPETIASFEGKSVTIQHPSDFVSPENWKQLTKGILQNVRRGMGEQENDLVADLLITDSVAITLVKSGLREVSCGYEADYVQTGIGRGMQTKIVGNHLALVEEGRAGSSYAINDHKGKGLKMTIGEKIKAIFAKAQDEAMKVADMNTETPEAKTGFVSYDDFKKWSDDFGSKMDSFMGKKGGDASTAPTENEPAKIVAKDEEKPKEEMKSKDAEAEELEKKKAARDAWIDAQMEKESKAAEDDKEDGDGEEEVADDDMGEEEGALVGDSASRIEILAPGLKATGKDAKAKALVAAYATKDGKIAIDHFTGGKAPNTKDELLVNAIFIGASELLKSTRSAELAGTRTRDNSVATPAKGAMSPEQVNELNQKHYANRAAN